MKKYFAFFAIAVFTLSINAQKIATGYHSLVINGDGSLWAWGRNDYGQLGDGTTVDKKTPIKVMENVVQVAEGGYHTLAVKADGSLWAWGYNYYGQLGDGTTDKKISPVKIMDNVVQVAAGYSHTLVVKTDGSLWAWGYNSDGQLGDGTSGSDNNKATPVKIMDNVVQVAAGRYHTLAIKADGSLWAWGYNYYGQLGDGTSGSDNNKTTPVKIMDNVAQVAAGEYSTFAIKEDGSLWAWGNNSYGQIGDGTARSKNIPVKVMEDVIMVTGGDDNSFFLKNDGTLWGCGHINYLGLMQSGANYYISTPIQIMKDVSQVVSKSNNTLCISTDGKVMVWGDNTSGQLGSAFIDYLIPTKVPMSGKTGFVAAGTNSSFVISTSGDLYGCGANEDGELGLGDCYSKTNYSVISSNIVQVAAGDYHTLAIKADGSLWAWGYNGSGRLGDGTTDKKTVPVKVVEDVVQVAAGGYHTLAVKADGSLWAWGYNGYGQLGDGTTVGKKTPIKVMEKVVQVAAGGSHTLAVKEDGSLWAWGYNNYGQIGDGTSGSDNNKTTPVKIMDNVVQVAAGYYHTLAVKADGSLWAWGYNLYGQLGDGTSGSANSKATPVKIMDNVSHVAAGGYHTLAVKADGSLWAWGANSDGQLGDGNMDYRKPTPIKIMDNVVQIAAGDYHTLAVKADGSLWAWGYNYYGQLGQGTKGFSETPIQIMKINNSSSTTNISFDDLEVKRICVVNWDTNGDGELSKAEAAAVTDLGEVFRENKEIKSFDELQYFTSVTKLNSEEFYYCSSLASIILPNSLRSTGQNVFCGCYALSHIGWPENDGFTLNFGIFQHCPFSSISLPSNLTSFSGGTFVQCYDLTEILVDDANPYYQTIDGVVYSKDRKTVVAYPNGKDLTEYTILSGVEEIGRDALGYCNKLVHLSIPASVNKLGNSCFESMSALKSLVIPEAVTEIPPYCCAWNYSLEEVNIPDNTTKIGRYAFAGNKIASIVLPSKIAEIEEWAFARNKNLEKVVSKIENPFAIDETVFEVEEGVFTTATLYVPIGTKSKYQSIAGWNKFANIVEQQTSEDVAIEGVVYSIDPDTKTATVKQIVADFVDLVIPESVTYNDQDYTVTAVGSSIFSNGIYNYYIYSVEFPSTITSVETNAFAGTYLSMAIVWNSDFKLSLAHFDQFSANFILYVKRAELAPSGIPIVVVNGVADEVTLKDGYVFNCPQEFTAKKISYTHNYKMETGAGECAGWETIVLPFEVQTITHATKGELTPFALWTSDSSRKPFWLFSLSDKGFIKASVIEANTPYIISMPNNSSYSSSYNVSGEVTFSATNAKVSRTGDAYLDYSSYDGAILWPCYSAYSRSSNLYALNVTNDFFTYNGTEKAGSMFISNYRAVYPFEAVFWKSTAEARGINIVFADDGTTAVEDVLIQADEDRRIVIYSLNGHLVGTVKKQGFDRLWNSLPKGVYIVNGKKRIK